MRLPQAVGWSPVKAAKFTTTLNCSLTELRAFLTDHDQLMKLDPLLMKIENFCPLQDTDACLLYKCYSAFKGPVIGVSKRDFVNEICAVYLEVRVPRGRGWGGARASLE